MAQFFTKEQYNTGSVPQYQASTNNLAKDFGTLFSALGSVAQQEQKYMMAESKVAGGLVARDKLMQLIKMQEEMDRQKQADPTNFDYEGVQREFDSFMATSLKETQDKFGKESDAYKTFEEGFLLQGTKLSEGYKTKLFTEQDKLVKSQTIEKSTTDITTIGNGLGEAGIKSTWESMKVSGANAGKTSEFVVNEFISKVTMNDVDVKDTFFTDGKADQKKINKFISDNFDSIVSVSKDGAISSKHDFLQNSDVAKIQKYVDSLVSGATSKNTHNLEFYTTELKSRDAWEKSSFKSSADAEAVRGTLINNLEQKLLLAPSPSYDDIKKFEKFKIDTADFITDIKRAEILINSKSDGIVGVALQDGFINETKINKEVLKTLVNNKLNDMYSSIFQSEKDANGNEIQKSQIQIDDEIRTLIAKEKSYGMRSSMFGDEINSLTNLESADPKTILSSIQKIKMLNNAGYTTLLQTDNLNTRALDAMEKEAYNIQKEGITDEEEIRKRITLAKVKVNARNRSLVENKDAISSIDYPLKTLFADDDEMQNFILNTMQDFTATNIDVSSHIVGGNENTIEVLKEYMANKGIVMDGYANFDSAGNKEILEKEMKIFKPVTTAIGDTRVMMMPTYINGNTRRTLEPEEFINGIIKYTKNVSKDDSINKSNMWDKLKFKYANDPSEGIVIDVFRISEDGTPTRVGRPSGFDLVQLANRKTIEDIKQQEIDDAMLYAF